MIDSDFEAAPSNSTPDFPWPPRENDSILEAAVTTWKESLFHPTSFFRRMPREFDFGWVLGYYLVVGVIGAGLSLFWQMVLGPSPLAGMFMPEAEPGNPVVEFLLSPLILFVVLWVVSGIVHLFLLMFGARKYGYLTTTRVFCFSSGPTLFEVVPFIGPVVGSTWSLVITIIGLREAHETTTGRAVAAVFVPVFFLLILLGLIFIVGFMAGATQLSA